MALGLIDRFRRRRDPVQRLAGEHLYGDRRQLSARIRKFLDAPMEVQRQVLVELDAVADLRQPGARGPAAVAIIAAVTTAGTLLTTYLIGLLGSAIASVPVDPATGEMEEDAYRALDGLLGSTQMTILVVGVCLVMAAMLLWLVARDQDRERVQAAAWARIFRHALAERAQPRRTRPFWGGRKRDRVAGPHN